MLIEKPKWIYRAYRYRLKLEPQSVLARRPPAYINNFLFLGA
jgi:hypothetical protein